MFILKIHKRFPALELSVVMQNYNQIITKYNQYNQINRLYNNIRKTIVEK